PLSDRNTWSTRSVEPVAVVLGRARRARSTSMLEKSEAKARSSPLQNVAPTSRRTVDSPSPTDRRSNLEKRRRRSTAQRSHCYRTHQQKLDWLSQCPSRPVILQ